jgi:subtilisin family serine protease
VTVTEQHDETASEGAVVRAGLAPLMRRTRGRQDVVVGLIDGPIAIGHPDLASARLQRLGDAAPPASDAGAALAHGTFVAGMLCAERSSAAPAICPGCTIVHRVLFEGARAEGEPVSAPPRVLADGVVACVDAGAEIVNLSVAAAPSPNTDRDLQEALSYAMARGAVVVAAAGNDWTVGGSTITRHPGVLPVTALSSAGRPLPSSTIGRSIGRNGIAAPGERITSLAPGGGSVTWTGTSAAAPFVTGALALLRSLLPSVRATRAAMALRQAPGRRSRSIVPTGLAAHAALILLTHSEARR